MGSAVNEKTHLAAWVSVTISISFLVVLFLVLLLCYARKIFRKKNVNSPIIHTPNASAEIKEIRVDQNSANCVHSNDGILDFPENCREKNVKSEERRKHVNAQSQSGSLNDVPSVESGGLLPANNVITSISPGSGLPESSHLGWGHWFTLRDLETATDKFSKENVIGEGEHGVVYQGRLINGALVAVKRILSDSGQAEREFRVEVEAIGHVRHKHLVRLLGFCMEGTHRLLVYEYINNGNLQQWLHGAMSPGDLTWEGRMKILLGAARAIAYLHDSIEPKVVHRNIKPSNILIDDDFNAKISDFGLAKLLGRDRSHVITRVMGTFGYVAPEYASSGLLNEKSDVYSFGVVMLEAITGRKPVNNSPTSQEKKLVDWVKMMVLSKRADDIADPKMETRPSTATLKRALLTAMRCVDSNLERRPSMIQVVRMLEPK